MHSYGGVVGTEATHESLGKKFRQSKGLSGGVVRLVYVCAFMLPLGEPMAPFGGKLAPYITINADGSCTMQKARRRFHHDLPTDAQDQWLSELKPHPASAQLTPLTYLAYNYHPTSYPVCEIDQALPAEVQKMMVARYGANVQTEPCTAGHSPFLVQPETVLEMVKRLTT